VSKDLIFATDPGEHDKLANKNPSKLAELDAFIKDTETLLPITKTPLTKW
jgi:hypothetical protein